MGIKEIRALTVFVAAVFVLTSCENEYEGLQYLSSLKESYNGNGNGKAVPLTVEKAVELDGTITNNGAYICFSSDRERGNFDVYLRGLNDIETVRLTSHSASDHSPAISPNGKYITFVSNREDPEGDIFYVRIRPKEMIKWKKSPLNRFTDVEKDIKNITQVKKTNGEIDSVKDASPSWSPDTSMIAFSSTRGDGYTENIWVCERDGDKKRQITTLGGMYPRFSPDGKKLVYISYRDSGSNGNIYMYDFATGSETRITEGGDIELNPSFGADSETVIYTLISEDTNGNGGLDLKDRSDLFLYNINSGFRYKLVYSGNSVFSAKYFPAIKIRYENSRTTNFSGVVIYCEQKDADININMVPSYGIIPRRPTAALQLELAEQYGDKNVSFEQQMAAYMRVYYFHGIEDSDESRISVLKALKKYSMYMKKTGKNSEIKNMISMINTSENLEKTGYSKIILNYLKLLLGNTNDAEKYLSGLLVDEIKDTENSSVFREAVLRDLAEHYSMFGERDKAAGIYKQIISETPDADDIKRMRYGYVRNSGNFDEQYFSLVSTPEYRNRMEFFIIREIERNNFHSLNSSGNFPGDERFIRNLNDFNESFQNFRKGNYKEAKSGFVSLLSATDKNSIIFYKANLYLYELEKREKNSDRAYSFLSAAAMMYDVDWMDENYESYVDSLINYYEETGLEHENSNRMNSANELYREYASLIDKFRNDETLSDLYNRYAARSQVLLIDTYVKRYPGRIDKLVDLENEYLLGLNQARKNYDKAHIYGLAYIYLNKALLIDYYYKNGNLKTLGNYSASDIAENIRKCVEHLDWSIFMDDYFIDAYMLRNWATQYVEVRKREDRESRGSLYSKLDSKFSSYLLEDNINSYLKAIEKNNEKLKPEEEGNLYLNLGNTYFLINNFLKAAECYKKAEKFKTAFSSTKEEALFYFHYAYSFWQNGDVKSARDEIDKSYQIYTFMSSGRQTRDNAAKMIDLLRFYSLFESLNRNYAKAAEIYMEIISLARSNRIEIDNAAYELNIAYSYKEMGKFNESIAYLNSASKDLAKRKDNDPKYYLGVKFLGFGPLNIINLGPDSAAFGNTRLFAPLSNYEKKLLMYSIYEDIYVARNDHDRIIETLNRKEKLASKRKTIFSRDLRIRTLNNIAYQYFLASDYTKSELYFKKAMKLSSDKENGDAEGFFVSVNNLANLYQYIAENRIKSLENPVKVFDDLISVIRKYRDTYEKTRYEEEKKTLEAALKAERKKITAEDKDRIREEVSREAEEIYYKIDLVLANLNFYRTGFLESEGFTGTGASKIYNDNRIIYENYVFSKNIYENTRQNYMERIEERSRISLLLNLAEIYEKTSSYEKAYSCYGDAEKMAVQYGMSDLLVDVYFRQASFLTRHYSSLEVPLKSAERYFAEADKLVSDFPPLYHGMLERISQYYREYAFYLADRNDAEGSFRNFEFSKKLLIIKSLVNNASDAAENQLLTSLVSDIAKYEQNNKQIFLKKDNPGDVKTIEKLRKENQQIIESQKGFLKGSVLNYLIEKKSRFGGSSVHPIIMCEYRNKRLYFYSGNEKKLRLNVEKINSSDPVSIQMSGMFLQKLSETESPTVIMNEFLMDNLDISDGSFSNVSFNSAFLSEFVTASDRDIYSESVYVLEKPFQSLAEEEKTACGVTSVICDNATPLKLFSNMLQRKVISPSFVLKRIVPEEGFKDILYFAFSVHYSSIEGTMIFYSDSDIPVSGGLPAFSTEESSLLKMNTYSEKNGKYINIGSYGNFLTGEQARNGTAFFNEMTRMLNSGNFMEARVALYRWNILNQDRKYGEREYYDALISQNEYNYVDAGKTLKSVNPEKITDVELYRKFLTLDIYLDLVQGDPGSAKKKLERYDFSEIEEADFYRDIVAFTETAEKPRQVPAKTIFERNRLVLLELKYTHAINGAVEAAALINEEKKLSVEHFTEADRIYVSYISEGRIPFTGKDRLLKKYYDAKSLDSVKGWQINTDQADAAEVFKLMKIREESVKANDYDFLQTVAQGIDISEINGAGNMLDELVLLSEIFRIAGETYTDSTASDLYEKFEKNKRLSRSFAAPSLIALLIEQSIAAGSSFSRDALKNYTVLTGQESRFFAHVTEMKILSAAYENDFSSVKKIISETSPEMFTEKNFIAYSKIFAGLDDVRKDENRLIQAQEAFLEQIALLNKRSSSLKLLADRIIDNFIIMNNSLGKFSEALFFSSLKKQIAFNYGENFDLKYINSTIHQFNNRMKGPVLYGSVISADYAGIAMKKLNSGSIILSFEKIGEDIYVYKIGKSEVEFFSIKDGYSELQKILLQYREILRKQEDTYLISQVLRELFGDVFADMQTVDTIYLIHDEFLEDVPFELIKTDSILSNDYFLYYLSSLRLAVNEQSAVERNVSISGKKDSFDRRMISLILKESGITTGPSSENVHFMEGPVMNRFTNDLQDPFPGEGKKLVIVNENSYQLSENRIADLCRYKDVDYVIVSAPVIRDINISYFYGKFYDEFMRTGDIRLSFSKAIRMTVGSLRYKNAVNWEKIRLYVTGL